MSNYIVAIPSYGRSEVIGDLTLPVLLAGGVAAKDIVVVVDEPEERVQYVKALAGRPEYDKVRVIAHQLGPGLWRSRNWATRTLPAWCGVDWVIQVDDDVKKIARALDPVWLDVEPDVDRLIRDGCRIADEEDVRLWGVYPVDNPYFMRPRVRAGLLYIEGAFWGIRPRGDSADLVAEDDAEDYARSLRCWDADGAVIRIEHVGIDSDYYKGGGGMVERRTDETNTRAKQRLHDLYPLVTRTFRSKSRDQFELAFRTLKYRPGTQDLLVRELDVPLPLAEDEPRKVVRG